MALDRQNGHRLASEPPPPDPQEVADLKMQIARLEGEPTPDDAVDATERDDRLTSLRGELARAQRTCRLNYVNAYSVTRHYGGPEEGGWWYDVGRPLASVPCWTDDQIDAAKAQLHTAFDHEYAPLTSRYSVLGEADLLVVVEDHVATSWPAETPHYE